MLPLAECTWRKTRWHHPALCGGRRSLNNCWSSETSTGHDHAPMFSTSFSHIRSRPHGSALLCHPACPLHDHRALDAPLDLLSPTTRRRLRLTPKGATPYNPAVPRHIVAHVLGAIVTLILLAVALLIAIPIYWFVGPSGLLVAIPFVLLGVAFWVLVWMVSNGLVTGFQFLRHWLVRVSDGLKLSGQHASFRQHPRRRVVHWFGATVAVILAVVGLVFGGMGVAMAGTAFGLPAAIPFVLIGLGIWAVLAWVFSRGNDSLKTPRSTLPLDGSEKP